MKVLIFCPKFYPFKGGLENFAFALAREYTKKGYKVHVCTHNHGRLRAEDEKEGIRIHRLDSWNILKDVYALPIHSAKNKRIWDRLKREHFDAVFTNTRFFMTSVQGAWFAKKQNIPHIHIEHGNVFVRHNNPLIWLLSRLYEYTLGSWVFRSSTITVGISKACAAFAKKMGARRVRMIPNAITLPRKKFARKKTSKDCDIVFVGRLIYAKGVQDIITGCAGLKSVHLHIVGDGPYKEQLKAQAEEKRVRKTFHGARDLDDIYALLNRSDIFINPSYSEGLPTSVLEAGATGIAVIATDVGGTTQIIRHKKEGLLFKPGDTLRLKQHVISLKDDRKLREKLGSALYKRIREKFTWESTMKKWMEVLPR